MGKIMATLGGGEGRKPNEVIWMYFSEISIYFINNFVHDCKPLFADKSLCNRKQWKICCSGRDRTSYPGRMSVKYIDLGHGTEKFHIEILHLSVVG
jgi:hypothetical protein